LSAASLSGGGDRRPSLLAYSALERGGARPVDGCRAREPGDNAPIFGPSASMRGIRTAVRCGREDGGDVALRFRREERAVRIFRGNPGWAGGGWRSITPNCRLAGHRDGFFSMPFGHRRGLFSLRSSIRGSPLSRKRSLRSPTRKPPGRSNKRPGWRIRPSAFPGGKASAGCSGLF